MTVIRQISDSQLVELCLARDHSAWSEFVERFSKVVYWAIKDRLRRYGYKLDSSDADDIFQEVFVAIWRHSKLSEIRNREKLSGWLVMVAGNAAIDYIRKKRKVTNISSDQELTLAGEETSPAIFSQEAAGILESLLNMLPSRERIVVTLNYLYDKKHVEISRILGIPINTVSTIISRTKDRLRRELKKKGIEGMGDI